MLLITRKSAVQMKRNNVYYLVLRLIFAQFSSNPVHVTRNTTRESICSLCTSVCVYQAFFCLHFFCNIELVNILQGKKFIFAIVRSAHSYRILVLTENRGTRFPSFCKRSEKKPGK